MFWLGLLLAVCFVPGYTGASIPTQWAVLSIILPLSLWRTSRSTSLHKLLFVFIAYATLSILWSINLYSWAWGMWLAMIWALTFHLGSTLSSLEPLWKGLAIGLGVSSAVAVAQALDYIPVEANDVYQYSGLLFNTSVQGITIALVLIGLTIHHLWWYMPPLGVGLILAGSRGAFLILAIALLARYTHWLLAVSTLVLGALVATYWLDPSDSKRLQIWGVALGVLSFFGNGAGSFIDIHYIAKIKGIDTLIRPEFVHNDLIQLWYEYGIGALALFAVFAMALWKTANPTWPIFFATIILSIFYFPLYAPLQAFILFIVAGHIARDWVVDGSVRDHSRSDLLPRSEVVGAIYDPPWGQSLSVVPRTSHTEA